MPELHEIQASLVDCQLCPLGKTRGHLVVFGEGDPGSPVMFIGEGPGEEEDRTGRPFVGKAGQLLTRILSSVGIAREDVYITNVVKCRPPGNRVPTDGEMQVCGQFLKEQVRLIDPKILVLMGNVAKGYFLGQGVGGITKVRGTYFSWEGRLAVPVYHPSYLLRNESRAVGGPKWQMWQDMLELRRRLDAIRSGSPAAAPEPAATPEEPDPGEKKELGPGPDEGGRQLKLF